MEGDEMEPTEGSVITLDQVFSLAKGLTPLEKLRLIEQLALELESALQPAQTTPTPRRSLRGLLRGCTISSDDIAEARREAWGDLCGMMECPARDSNPGPSD